MARHRELDELVAELAEAQHGAFAFRQLGALWCDRRLASERVRRGEWERVLKGTYALPSALDDFTVPAAWCLHLPYAVVGGTCAASWWQLDGTPEARMRLLVPPQCGLRHRFLSRAGDLAPWEATLDQPDGCLRVTDPTRTLIDIGPSATGAELERMVESAIRHGLTSEARLRARARQLRGPGRVGPTSLLAVLDGRPRGGNADSDGEVILLQLLRAAGLPAPVRQHRIGPARFDLAWPDQKVIVELDGRNHRTAERTRRDARKQNAAVVAGWHVLRFTYDRIEEEPEAVVAEVAAALMMRTSA